MTEIVVPAAMRALEAATIASGAVSGLELMERAGRAVVEAIIATWPDVAQTVHQALVLCGPGNNGGDGYVVARLLRERGWGVRVLHLGNPEHLPPDAHANYRRWCVMGTVAPLAAALPISREADIVVDALFGIGLSRPLDLPLGILATREGRGARTRVVAVDIPSGICAESGRPLGTAVAADLTVTFHTAKPGHLLAKGPAFCGRLAVRPIGIGGAAPPGPVLRLTGGALSALARGQGHKFSHGHALVLAGGAGRGGAARLAARAALRIGAGLVTLGCPPEALAENAARLDAVMLYVLPDAPALSEALVDRRVAALVLGPGLGTTRREAELVETALAARRPSVLDADALRLIAADARLFQMLHPACVLTPHAGEFAALFPDIAARLAAPATTGPAFSKLEATRAAAARAGCCVLFKGPDTVIADPAGAAAINAAHYDRATPWLATAGAGDVLAGFIGGLLARGFAPMPAADAAAWLHVECARSFGPGLIAEDLPDLLPQVLRGVLGPGG
jgi:hydroxyethylthiazole kinase-like uncharacterized protein yjeF